MILLQDRLLIKPISTEKTTKSGIILTSQKSRHTKAIVIKASTQAAAVCEGDTINIYSNSGIPYSENGEEYLIVSESKDVVEIL